MQQDIMSVATDAHRHCVGVAALLALATIDLTIPADVADAAHMNTHVAIMMACGNAAVASAPSFADVLLLDCTDLYIVSLVFDVCSRFNS